jgi:hypothetical protein
MRRDVASAEAVTFAYVLDPHTQTRSLAARNPETRRRLPGLERNDGCNGTTRISDPRSHGGILD